MSPILIILAITAVGATAALVTFIVHRRIELELRRHYHEVSGVVFLQLGIAFSVLLAFVFNGVWTGYTDAARAIDHECGALHETAILATTLRGEQAQLVLSAERDYIRSVVDSEWRIMARDRTESIETDNKLRNLIIDVANLRPADPNAVVARGQMLPLLATAHAYRETRIFEANSGVPATIWLVLAAFSIVLTLCASFSSFQFKAASVVIAAIFASGIASVLVMVRLLDFPFEGPLALNAADFSNTLVKVTNLLSGGVPQVQ
jgi:Protein of unknown function (DUF4239)